MRRFFLQNSLGDRRDLQTRGKLFFHAPTGLGFSDTNTYAPVEGFFVCTYREPVQGSVAGELVFGSYADYKDFADWVFSGYDLALVYAPDGIEYLCDVDIVTLSKGELARGVLVCPVAMSAKTPWYKATSVNMVIAPPAAEKDWSRLPFALPARFAAGRIDSALEIAPAGHMPAAIRVEAAGPLVNPRITLRDIQGQTLGLLDLAGVDIAEGETLVFSTRFGEVGVYKGDTDLLDKIDLGNNSFFSVPQNRASTLILSSASTITTAAVVRLYEYYRTV